MIKTAIKLGAFVAVCTVFTLYLGRMWPALGEGSPALSIEIAMIVLCVAWNLCGARSVGEGSVAMTTEYATACGTEDQ